nr:hypothetical protein CTI12_AA298070 [Tanacetum cinerariifolium]
MQDHYLYVWEQLMSCNETTAFLQMLNCQTEVEENDSKPMPWIGIYIALASFVCIFAMVSDLVHGLRNRLLWFPCKNFTLNSASLIVIAVAMKLPMDLSLTILKSKQIIESKYQTGHETAVKDLELQQTGRFTVKMLKQHVSNHWIMASSGSPQFITSCSATTSASGVVCATSTAIHAIIIMIIAYPSIKDYASDYKWSMLVILITQFTGSVFGTIAPFSRCFAALSFKMSIKWIQNHFKVFKVESYWTHKLTDWQQRSVRFLSSSRRCKIIVQDLKVRSLSFCIKFQKTVVVVCKMIALIPMLFVICVLYCIRCWEWMKSMFSASETGSVQNPEKLEEIKELSRYVLKIQDDMELTERTLKGITKSVNRLILKAENQQPIKLMKLLQESRGFEGVNKFDSHHVLLH